VAGAPPTPGVYLFRDAHRQVLYVGRARDLRARLRSYLAGGRQRPAVEAARGALAQVEWQETGSELEAAIQEARLIRELRPPANARGKGGSEVWLRRQGASWSVVQAATRYGPISGKTLARRAARALDGHDHDDPRTALPPLRDRLRLLAGEQRFEDAARLRDRIAALERVVERLTELQRLRALEACVIAPAREQGYARAVLVSGGRIAATRTVPLGAGAGVEVDAALAEAEIESSPDGSAPDGDDGGLAVVASFLKRPPPELRVVPLERNAILAALGERVPFAA
jgi:excinuclease UvrABC nuclease subunit